jgi:GT2 family glycosyltransferase
MILAIKYEEANYAETVKSIKREDIPVWYVDRNPAGVGSLAEAINRGLKESGLISEFCWITTNIRFNPGTYLALVNAMIENPDLAAVAPAYLSDHAFLRPSKEVELLKGIPFMEFTAAMVRTKVLREFPLDEDMPYVGFDLDWGYRVRQAGYDLASLKTAYVGHEYIRHSKREPITRRRLQMRKMADAKTTAKLVEKYGANWPDLMNYHSGIAIR